MKINIFWLRRDLRLNDNAGLFHALSSGNPVLPIFIFDTDILNMLDDKRDRRVEFIFNALNDINDELKKYGSRVVMFFGRPVEIWKNLAGQLDIAEVFANHDYEPYAIERDREVRKLLERKQIKFNTYKDQVIFEKNEVVKSDGKPYTVFTPYSKAWRAKLAKTDTAGFEINKSLRSKFVKNIDALLENNSSQLRIVHSLNETGFNKTGTVFPSKQIRENIIEQYDRTRDFPAIDGTSRLSVHLRFGTISLRALLASAMKLNDTWLSELIWREFFVMILYHFPRVVNNSFKPAYDRIQWRNNENEFEKWCKGMTGYPIVDAGMRELNQTGYMHNRVRMITAGFLCKHLLIDWRWGEAYFALKLLDYDLAANNGNWQWAAGSGCDAAPYFRIFNPGLQTKRFDPELKYIKKWITEFEKAGYPLPIVEHSSARERALKTYREALTKTAG